MPPGSAEAAIAAVGRPGCTRHQEALHLRVGRLHARADRFAARLQALALGERDVGRIAASRTLQGSPRARRR
jgi:hypothetical protein